MKADKTAGFPWTACEAESVMSGEDARQSTAVAGAVSELINYAPVLWSQDKRDHLPDLRDLVDEMVWVWAPTDGADLPDGPTKLQQECQRRITAVIKSVRAAVPPAPLSREQAETIINGLSAHAQEMSGQGDLLSVWQCCRLAKQLQADYGGQAASHLTLHGNFIIDESERFTNFGSQDREHVAQGRISGRPVLVFREPLDVDRIPEGWQCYHLAGRNIRETDHLWKFVPRDDYTGTILSPTRLINSKRPAAKIEGQFKLIPGLLPLEAFCEQHGLPQERLSGLFPETQELEEAASGMTIGGI